MNPIPYGKQQISDEDIEAVVETLKSDLLTQGPKVSDFEDAFAKYIGAKYAIAVSNGTAALHLSTLALDTKPGDQVITTPITFAASANCIKYIGGNILFADIDPNTFLLDLNKTEDLLKKNKNIKGIIPVDFAGHAVNLEEYKLLADKYKLWLLEDACHAPGAHFTDSKKIEQKCGNATYTDLAVFSFHPVKHIACGEGGMITTNNKELYKKLCLLRTHGITKDPKLLTENHGGWYYEMQQLGYNYRITDFQCALGASQLKRAKKGLEQRNRIAEKYNNAFKNIEIKTPTTLDFNYHAFHLYVILTDQRLELYNYLRENGIFCQVHYIPLHLQPYYKNLGWEKGDLPIAEDYYNKCLSLPMYPTLSDTDQDYVIEKILNFVTK